jgi:hypothetical protein
MIVGLPNGVRHREKYDIAVKIIDLRKKLRLGEFVARAIDKNRFIRIPQTTGDRHEFLGLKVIITLGLVALERKTSDMAMVR